MIYEPSLLILLNTSLPLNPINFHRKRKQTAIWTFWWWPGEKEEHIAKSPHAWATSGTASTSPTRANCSTANVCTCDNSPLANNLRYVFNCYFHHFSHSNFFFHSPSGRGEVNERRLRILQKSRATRRNPINLLSNLIENFFFFFLPSSTLR